MTKLKVSVDYSTHNYSDKDLNTEAETVSNNLTDNPHFPTLKEVAGVIKAKRVTFSDLLAKMAAGSKLVTAEKKNVRTELEDLLSSTALKVQDISGGDEVMILSAGFHINRKPTPVGILTQPINVQVKQGILAGSLDISWDAVPHANSYEIRYMKTPKTELSVFSSLTNTKRKVMIENLIPGQTYIVQVAGVGSDPKRVWSVEVVSCYVS